MAQLKDFNYKYETLRTIATWSATFIASYPYWLAATGSSTTKVIGTDVASGEGFTIANAGNAPARVKVEITAPAGGISDDIQIDNNTTSESMKYRGDLAASKVLEIDNRYDTDDFEVLNDGEDDTANFEGDFITLNPGNNTIVFTGTTGSSVKITHRPTYY